jgi:hypothetical protein
LLRLRCAALDFAVDGAGRWWFLEINPNGQWLWIEHATGLPIAAAVAAALRLTHDAARSLAMVGPPWPGNHPRPGWSLRQNRTSASSATG